MSKPETRAEAMRNGFLVQLGIFVVVTGGVALYTALSEGDFWWFPVVVFWGLSLIGYGVWAYWIWRRDRWESESQQQRQRLFAPPNPLD